MEDHQEGPGSAVIIVYAMMVLWGMLIGVGLGWLIWG